MRLSDFEPAAIVELLSDLKSEATKFVRSCDADAPILSDYKVYMRYSGQGWEIPVTLSEKDATQPVAETYQQRFEQEYTKLFGRSVEGLDIEIAVWAVNATTPPQPVTPISLAAAGAAAAVAGNRSLFDPALGHTVDATIVERDAVDNRSDDPGTRRGHRGRDDRDPAFQPSRHPSVGWLHRCLDQPGACTMTQPSTVSFQVMWNRLISVVEEQAQALVRTAFSTSVREAGDLSAGVYDLQGRMLAQAVTGTPGHVNAMAESVAHFMRRIGRQNMFEGDVYITNDPWEGTGHLHDITVVSPSFRDGVLVGYFACTAHITDIGGRGFGADANSVYEEGLYIPVMKFAERGDVDQTLIHMIRGNTREPDQLIGDVYALAACNEIGHRRLMEMMDEFDLSDIDGVAAFVLDNSRRANDRADRRSAPSTGIRPHADRRLREADRPEGPARHPGGPDRRQLRRHLAGRSEGHQRAAGLYQGLYLLCPEMRDRTRDPEQCRVTGAVRDRSAGWLHPERPAPRRPWRCGT